MTKRKTWTIQKKRTVAGGHVKIGGPFPLLFYAGAALCVCLGALNVNNSQGHWLLLSGVMFFVVFDASCVACFCPRNAARVSRAKTRAQHRGLPVCFHWPSRGFPSNKSAQNLCASAHGRQQHGTSQGTRPLGKMAHWRGFHSGFMRKQLGWMEGGMQICRDAYIYICMDGQAGAWMNTLLSDLWELCGWLDAYDFSDVLPSWSVSWLVLCKCHQRLWGSAALKRDRANCKHLSAPTHHVPSVFV